MDKENGERDKPSAPGDVNPLLDPLNLFSAGHGIFGGGMPSSYGHPLTNAYSALLAGGRGGQFQPSHHPPTTSSYGSLGTLSVAASQAASLGITQASAAWWTMASHLAAQDYLARLQAAGMPFSSLPPDMQHFPLMSPQHPQVSGSGKGSAQGHGKSSGSLHGASSTATSGHPHHRDALTAPPHHKDKHMDGLRLPGSGKQSAGSHGKSTMSRSSGGGLSNLAVSGAVPGVPAPAPGHGPPPGLHDPGSVLGGVRLPPDTEIIKYTSSIIGPKVPGTTNRGRKKTISLDPPSVSVTPSHNLGLPMPNERTSKNKSTMESSGHSQLSPQLAIPSAAGMHSEYTSPMSERERESDLAELMKIQNRVSNGQVVSPVPSGYQTPPDCDAPLNLSLKPSSTAIPQTPNNALQSLSSLSQSLSLQMTDRISRRKPGPKPRRVTPSPLPPPGPAPSASLAQLFAAADSPRPTSATDDTDLSTHHRDGRPRNLGRGVSKPKKNTVASLLAQSRALGLKPGIDQVSLLKLQQQLQGPEGDSENEEKTRTSSPGNVLVDEIEKNKKLLQQANLKSLEELKALVQETYSETSSVPDVSSDTISDSDSDSEADAEYGGKKREGDPLNEDRPAKKKKIVNEEELRIPLQLGWKRETIVRSLAMNGQVKGDVTYMSPCGRRFRQYPEVLKYLEQNNIKDLSRDNFSFSLKVLVGDFIYSEKGQETRYLSEQEMADTVSDVKFVESLRSKSESSKLEKEKMANAAREAKRVAKEEAARSKELARFLKEQEKNEKQEAIRKEREQRNIILLEARRKRQEEAGKLKQEEQQRKQQEREMKRQQNALLKEQIYMQELTKQRELLYTVEVERERRRQHLALVRSLETRKKQEEKEKRRLEVKAEKMASREKRMEQRRIEMDLLSEIRKPVEDMELPDLKPLPELNRIPGLKLSGQAFSDTLMVFEFLHNFGETLGFDMGSLPTLNSLQNALMGDEEAEEELLSVMTHLIICAIEDPGIPNPARHTTLLGQSLKQADITHSNISEILRIYLYANATGEVKALTGVQFEREREKRLSDHHNNMNESAGEEPESGKNAAFFVALRENPTWKMSEMLKSKPFLALNATNKAKILQFLCHELLQNKAVIRQIEGAIETVAQLKRDRWTNDSKLRKLRHLYNRKVRQMAIGMMGGKLPLEGVDDEPTAHKDHDDEEEGEGESGNESDGTQPEEEEDKKLSMEEMAKKLEKLNRQAEQTLGNLGESGGQLRAVCYGQDRYWRRYWSLPTAGGLYVEAMESADPDLFDELLQDDADSLETPDIKSEYDAEALQGKLEDTGDDDDEMPHLTPEVDPATLLSRYKKEENVDDEAAEMPLIKQLDREFNEKNGRIEEMETEETNLKNECSGGEEDSETKSLIDEKKSQSFQFEKSGEESMITNGQSDAEPAWFDVLPREPCDTTSVTSTATAFRCGVENSEVRIPVFPPPPASPSPSQCDSPSPAPLALTPDESVQLQHCKIHGLPRPAPAKPIPYELRCGWWRITDMSVLQKLVECLHTRGAREKELRRVLTRPCLDQNWGSTLRMCMKPGSTATELLVAQKDEGLPPKPPPRDNPEDWNHEVALRVDMAVLEQVEVMEDKVANASMQVKGWKVPPRASTEEGRQFQPSSSHPQANLNPIAVAKARLIDLECAIERRYMKPPLGVNVSSMDVNMSVCAEPDSVPKGLAVWREAVSKSQTAAQLSMAVHMLEASIAWDKSIMKANCQFCHSGDNEDKLLLCDGCDKGYHTYCFKPKMDNIPEGDWYCYECMNKATGDKCCIVCGKKLGRNLVVCDNCPKAYHTDCLQPPISKVPRGKWHCPSCLTKMPRKRLNAKRTLSSSNVNNTSPSSSFSRNYDDGASSNTDPALSSPMALEDPVPESPPPPQPVAKKEKPSGKKMMKEMGVCRLLLDDLETHDEAWPFLLPVNTKQFPTYKKIIKNPMDFSTIRKRLMDSVYKSREEFCTDVRLIFNNCETFNEDDSPVGKAGHNMRMFFETRWTELTNQKPPS